MLRSVAVRVGVRGRLQLGLFASLLAGAGCDLTVAAGGHGGQGDDATTPSVAASSSSASPGTGGQGGTAGEGGGCGEAPDASTCNLPIAATQHYTCDDFYGFDSATGRCEHVVGCPKNANSFETLHECYATCAPCLSFTCDLLPCRPDQICTFVAPELIECACPQGMGDCGGECVPLDTDSNCGGCGVNCNPEATGRSCEAGLCRCPDDTIPNLFTDSQNCGSCGHVCTQGTACDAGSCSLSPSACGGCSGACTYGRCVVALAENQNAPVAVDLDATSVYWTTGDGKVMKAPLDGGAATTLFDDGGISVPQGLAVDATNVYWATAGAVKSVPLGGGQAMTLATGSDATAVAVDGTHVYWTAGSAIMKVPVGGGAATTLATGQSASAIAIDTTSVYWPNVAEGTIMKVSLAGGAPTTLASGQTDPIAIAVDATRVYWTTQSNVMSVPIGGGTLVVLAANQPRPMAITVDATSVYFGNNQTQVIMKVPLGGGTPVPLADEGPIWWLALAVDDTSLYWADNVSGFGKVKKVTPK
jgi:hypothetical protein